ncbi:hypothetical protein [Desulfoluna sp.]|uniref:hypothetical protein n=1 Tax=Desulfoluna sp. TaxID=2045199 RepID=UPI002637458B|nr:hypothetical protein [Desulfoluna sp.]
MKRTITAALICFAATLFQPSASHARYDTSWRWQTLSNEAFTIYYPEGHEAFAQRVYNLSEEVYKDVTGYLGVKPRHCPVVINPGTDLFNGFYAPLPNRISLYETPYYTLREFGPGSDTVDQLFTHEFTHFVHLTTKLGWYGKITNFLGDAAAVSNLLSPGWVVEGLTTTTETLFTDGGRGRSPLFKGTLNSFAQNDGLWSLSAAGAHPTYAPPSGRIYLAGYHMIDYLNRSFGPTAAARMTRTQGEHPVGGIREALVHVTGQSPEDFYKGFLEDFQSQAALSDTLALSAGLPEGKVIASKALESFESHAWTEEGTLLALRRGYGEKNALVELDPATGTKVKETFPGTLLTTAPLRLTGNQNHVVLSVPFPRPLGAGELDTTDLALFDRKTRKYERLTRGAHIFSAAPSPDGHSFVAARRNGMWSDLVLLDANGKNISPLFSQPGAYCETPIWSPDGTTIAAVVKIGPHADIVTLSPKSGTLTPLFGSDVAEDSDPAFSPDGRYVLFASDRSGIWNIFAYNRQEKALRQLTSVRYGAFEPRVSPNGTTLSFTRLNQGVKELCTLPFTPETGPIVPLPKNKKMPTAKLDRVAPPITAESHGIPWVEAYKPFLHIPYFTSDEEGSALGVFLMGQDPVGLNSYLGSIFYGLESNRPGFDLTLTHRSFAPEISTRIYDSAEEGTQVAGLERWQRERSLELALSLPVILQSLPSHISLRGTAGSKIRKFDGIKNVTLDPNRDQSFAWFTEATLTRTPDAPRRDVLPTWGQSLFGSFEKSIDKAGGELLSHNGVLSLTHYLPGPADHDGFKLTLTHQAQEGDLSYSKDLSLPRGYDKEDTEGGMNLDKNLLASLEYHVPIAFPDWGTGLILCHVSRLKASLFADVGAGWQKSFDANDWSDRARLSIGTTLTAQSTLMAILPVEFGVEVGYKTEEKEGFANVIFQIIF